MSTLHKLLLILGLVACSEESAYFTYTPDYKFTKITTPEMAIINHLSIKRDTLPIKYAKPDSTTYLKVYSGFAIEKKIIPIS